MDLNKLRIFKAVAEAGSFTGASDDLHLSQSAISRQISALEKSVNVTLFHRQARGLTLTSQGEMLLQTAHTIFNKLQKTKQQLTDSKALPEGSLIITTVEFVASTWLAPLLPSFIKKYPDIQLSMLLDDRVYDLSTQEADVAIRMQKADHSELMERYLTTIKFSLCASKEYLNINGKPKNLEDFKNHIMIGFPPNMYPPYMKPNWIFKYLKINIHDNPKVILINSLQTRYNTVKSSGGISVLPNYIINRDDDLDIILPEIDIPGVDMYFVFPEELKNSKRIAALKDFLLEYIKISETNN